MDPVTAGATCKVRGQWVDLAQVEHILAGLPGIEDAAVTIVERADGDGRIIGHVVVRGDVGQRRLRALARAHMPRHMVPSAFVTLEALPRTVDGELDRVSLGLATPPSTDPSDPPVTASERRLVAFWEDALDIDGVGRDDDFFDLGGDSISAATVAIRVDEAHGIALSFDAFVDTPVLKDMAAAIDRARTGADSERLVPVARGAEAPTSLLQEPFWRASRAPAHAWRYTRAAAISLDGPLDRDALGAALDGVIARHEILRTRYRADADAVVQIVEPAAPVPLPLVDLEGLPEPEAELKRLLDEAGHRTLDLTVPPLDFVLLRLGPERHVLLRTGHHILDDAPSWNLFLRDLAAFYVAERDGGAVDLPALPIQYADFSIWQRRVWRPGSPRHDEALAWLAAKFGAEPRPPAFRTLPGYLRRHPLSEPNPRSVRAWGIEGATAAALGRLSDAESATFYVLRLACLAPVVSAITGHAAVVIGGVFTNRNNAAVEQMIGPLANLVPLVVRCDPSATFREHVRAVKAEVVEAHRHADLPLAELLKALTVTGIAMPSPFLWIHVPTPSPSVTAAGLLIRQRNVPYVGASGVVMVRFDPLAEEKGSTISIDPRLYTPELLDDLAHALRAYARIAAASPEATLADIAAQAALEPREN